jgi:hypothetical protein
MAARRHVIGLSFTDEELADLGRVSRARAWVGKKARELRPVHQTICQRVAEAAVRHLDETGYLSVSEAHRDIAGKLHWLHTRTSLLFTFCRAGEKRGDIPEICKGGRRRA